MRKTILLISLFLGMSITTFAEEKVHDAIYVWIDGQSTCYRLSSMPKITYSDSRAILSFRDETTPLILELSEGQQLKVVYGVYEEAGVETTHKQPIEQVGKYIRGGRLLIFKDGKLYDVNGRVIQEL